jgi:hypothetical protein
VFAFSKSFGSVQNVAQEIVYTIGVVQDNVISFSGPEAGMTSLKGLWSAFFSNPVDAMSSFYNDYENALAVGTALDAKVQQDSVKAAGQDYATITTLSVRQSFGALQFAGTKDEPYIFLKEISSNSDIQTVDVIFPAFPILLYLNTEWLKYLLEPLYVNQENGHYPKDSAIHDLGTFPVAKGYPKGDDEAMPLEECGNMIIMTLAYAQKKGDQGVAYLKQHYKLLAKWAEWLIKFSKIPDEQLSTDDFAGTLA